MSKKPGKIKEKKADQDQGAQNASTDSAKPAASPTGLTPWIKFKTGLIIITIASIGMAVLTATQYVPAIGWKDGLLYALLYGFMIWVVFLVSQLFFRWLRK